MASSRRRLDHSTNLWRPTIGVQELATLILDDQTAMGRSSNADLFASLMTREPGCVTASRLVCSYALAMYLREGYSSGAAATLRNPRPASNAAAPPASAIPIQGDISDPSGPEPVAGMAAAGAVAVGVSAADAVGVSGVAPPLTTTLPTIFGWMVQ